MRRLRIAALLALLPVLLAAAPLRAEETSRPSTAAAPDSLARALEIQAELAAIVDRVRPAVVSIEVEGRPGGQGPLRRGGGSGVMIDPAGLVLTNYHVAGWADVITVVLSGSRRVPAKLRGGDQEGDLALLELKTEGTFPFVELGDSDSLRVGQGVLAMGNPKSVAADGRAVVTWGTITALNTLGGGLAGGDLFYGDAIQTDAEINPGNSGGPLFDLDGLLIGINGRIASRTRVPDGTDAVNANVGFAIPANQIRRFLPLLRQGSEIRHGFLGVRVEQTEGLPGVRVVLVVPDSPARAAGIEPGERILAIDGVPVSSPIRLTNLLSTRPAGGVVAVRVRRGDEERIVTVLLAARPRGSR